MEKTTKILFNDYLVSKSEIDLKLFLNALNPGFKLNKSNKEMLYALIKKYESDKNSSRLKSIESFVSPDSFNKKNPIDKNSKEKDSPYRNSGGESKLKSLLEGPIDQRVIDAQRLATKLNMLRSKGISSMNAIELEAYEKVKGELFQLETELGYYDEDPEAQNKTELSFIKSLIGDWNIPGTIAHMMLNASQPRFEMISHIHPQILIDWLEKHSGQKANKYTIVSRVAEGQAGNGTRGSRWNLTLKGANLPAVTTFAESIVSM